MPNLISASIISTAGGFAAMLSGFLSSVVIARLLGPEGAGVVAYCLWLATTASNFSGLGIPDMFLRYANAPKIQANPANALFRPLMPRFTAATICLGFAVSCYMAWKWSQGDAIAPDIWLVSICLFLIYSYANLSEHALRGLFKFREAGILTVVGCLIQLPVVAIGAYYMGIAGGLVGYIARHLPAALFIGKLTRSSGPEKPQITASMTAVGRNTWLASLLGIIVWGRAEFLFLGWFATIAQIGFYAAALVFANLVVQLPTQILAGLTPFFGKHTDNQQTGQLTKTYNRVFLWISIIIFPICFGAAAVMPTLMVQVFGAEFADAAYVARVVIISAAATALSIIPNSILLSYERTDFELKATMVTAMLSIALFLLMVPMFGAEGAAWARLAVHTGWFLALASFSWRVLKVPIRTTRILLVGLAAGACALSAWTLISCIPGLLGLIVAIPSAAVVYAIALRITNVIEQEDANSIQSAIPARVPKLVKQMISLGLLFLVAPGKRESQS